MNWKIKCDFDGTISDRDTTDFVLENFAAPEWEEVEQEWKAGKIGSAECMGRQAELINATPEDIELLLDEVSIDPHFIEFIKFCDHWGAPISILSDGYDFNIHTILKKNGLNGMEVVANHLEYVGNNKFKFSSVHSHPDCRSKSGTCKCSKFSGVSREILIGDGRSDFCAAEKADIVIAKDSLLEFCRKKGIPHYEFKDFNDVKHIVSRLFMTEKTLTSLDMPEFIKAAVANLPGRE